MNHIVICIRIYYDSIVIQTAMVVAFVREFVSATRSK
jgi:hypothetical protein